MLCCYCMLFFFCTSTTTTVYCPSCPTLPQPAVCPSFARGVVLRLKNGVRAALAETVARPMARLLPADADLLVPVPLHRWRLWSRGFNQAALIAAAMTKASGVASAPTLLVRLRRTPPLRSEERRVGK